MAAIHLNRSGGARFLADHDRAQGTPAGCQPAIQPITNRRYSRIDHLVSANSILIPRCARAGPAVGSLFDIQDKIDYNFQRQRVMEVREKTKP